MVRMYRQLSMHEMAYKFAILGKKIEYPAGDTLFIERNCYDYLFDFEISIVASYLPKYKQLGREALSRLVQRDDLPQWLIDINIHNTKFYI